MNDPWDVKSVRQAGQYVSCMKINGVPLLPPVLSKECRKEMQYYKLLAKEVEKRIIHLKPYIDDSDTDSSEDKTDAPDLPECEHSFELPQDESVYNVNKNKIALITNETIHPKTESPNPYMTKDYSKNADISNSDTTSPSVNSPKKIVIDLSLSLNETNRDKSLVASSPADLPERDYNCIKQSTQKNKPMVLNSPKAIKSRNTTTDIVNFNLSVDKDVLSDPFPDLSINHDGPSSLSSKSFTGSLIDIHTESMRESQMAPKLIRQRSYTLLKPSPHLLAHLEVQSMNTGIEMSCISMSDSLSNLSSPGKKRRSWDLESAKMKWSTMALELKQNNIEKRQKTNDVTKNNVVKPSPKKLQSSSPPRSRSVLQDKSRRPTMVTKVSPKSEPVQKPAKKSMSPVRNGALNRPITKELTSKTATPKKEPSVPGPQKISESDDPATRVRELYEKIQKQQLAQMASLVEKQKREQILLQQVFEEQNNLLYKQLKTICPKSPIEVKQAWGDKTKECAERGPVSLSQLINHKPQQQCQYDSPVSHTLTETNNYINHCDDILKRSKDITSSLKKQPLCQVQNLPRSSSPILNLEGTKTRTHSPSNRTISRRLNYDTSASSEREYDQILTDRTNDTMADLNVTFPTDQSEDGQSFNLNTTVINQLYSRDVMAVQHNAMPNSQLHSEASDKSATVQSTPTRMHRPQANATFVSQPTPEQRSAARTIVAYARGYLVRRLLRTARVQGTVRTLRDALLCALQLHRERTDIRGADVGLHRRLIQQITAACYSLHDTFITSTAAERCAMIAADRARRRSLALRPPPTRNSRQDL
ncbi:hypothetical protein evm_009605 [Chilo suppressalis]|nr:hypothetical protein evm_009605 [Chilo suppressalis]